MHSESSILPAAVAPGLASLFTSALAPSVLTIPIHKTALVAVTVLGMCTLFVITLQEAQMSNWTIISTLFFWERTSVTLGQLFFPLSFSNGL